MAPQDVVDVDALNRQYVDIGNVARRAAEVLLDLRAADDQRIGKPKLLELRRQRAVGLDRAVIIARVTRPIVCCSSSRGNRK